MMALIIVLINEAKNIPEGLPKLYTMLNFLDKMPAKYLHFVEHKPNMNYLNKHKAQECDYFLRSKDGILGESSKCKFEALEDACVESSFMLGRHRHMSRAVFDEECSKNKAVTVDDVQKLSLNENIWQI